MNSDHPESSRNSTEEVDLYEIVQFLIARWKYLVLSAVVGGLLGLLIAFVLPEKYEATASIVGGRVAGRDIENQASFLDRIQSPSIYTEFSFAACDVRDQDDPSKALLKRIKYELARESGVINASVLLSTPMHAKRCLEAVLSDIKGSQLQNFDAQLVTKKIRLGQINQELINAEQRKKDELSLYEKELADANSSLKNVQQFLDKYGAPQTDLNVGADKFSAASLLVITTLEKQNQASELKRTIDRLQQKIKSQFTTITAESRIDKLQRESIELANQLDPPNTEQATLLAPVYASTQIAEPKRALISVAGILLGSLVGLCVLLLGVVRSKSGEGK